MSSKAFDLSKVAAIIRLFRERYPALPLQTVALFCEIASAPGITMKDLSGILDIAPSSVSRNCDLLSDYGRPWSARGDQPGLGLIETRPDPREHRRKICLLTPEGESLARDLAAIAAGKSSNANPA